MDEIVELMFIRDMKLKAKGRKHLTVNSVVKEKLDEHLAETGEKQSEFVTRAILEEIIRQKGK